MISKLLKSQSPPSGGGKGKKKSVPEKKRRMSKNEYVRRDTDEIPISLRKAEIVNIVHDDDYYAAKEEKAVAAKSIRAKSRKMSMIGPAGAL